MKKTELSKQTDHDPKLANKKYTLCFDGSCLPSNPGHYAGYGIVIKKDNKLIYEKAGMLPVISRLRSSNESEYKGLLQGLRWLQSNKLNKKDIQVFGDSNLVINQMFGTWKIKKGLYKDNAIECKQLLKEFPNIQGSHIYRDYNIEADHLSTVLPYIELDIDPKVGIEFKKKRTFNKKPRGIRLGKPFKKTYKEGGDPKARTPDKPKFSSPNKGFFYDLKL